jgi:hypothetical protein
MDSDVYHKSMATAANGAVQAPDWHGYMVLKFSGGTYDGIVAHNVMENVAHKAYQDHELRMCTTFVVIDHQNDTNLTPRQRLVARSMKPTVWWIPPLSEEHELHSMPKVQIPHRAT